MPTLIERLRDVFNSERRQRNADERAALESWAIAQQRLSLDHTDKAMLPATAETKQDVKRDTSETISPRETVNRSEERREYGVAILTTTDGSRAASVTESLRYGGIGSETRKNDMGIYTTYVDAEDLASARHWITLGNLGQDHTVRTGYSSAEEEYAVPVYATMDSAKSITAEARLAAAGLESYTRVDANRVAITYVHKDDVADARSSLSAANNAHKTMAQTYEKPAEMQSSYSAGM